MIKYAVDEYGNLCCADDSNAPQHVKCPLCGASEYRRNSPLGNPYYALSPEKYINTKPVVPLMVQSTF